MQNRLIVFGIHFLARLPLGLVRGLGAMIGWLLARTDNRQRLYAEVNLAVCLPDWDGPRRQRMLSSCLRESAKTLLEMPKAWLQGPDYWLRRIDANGMAEAMRDALAQGRGLIIAAPHLGNWEVGVHFLAGIGPIGVLYRPPRQAVLEQFMVAGRGANGATLVPTSTAGIRSLYKILGKGDMVAILPDQTPGQAGGQGQFAPFFGRPALTMTLVSRLARKTGAPVMFGYAARQEANRSGNGRDYQMRWFLAEPAIADKDTAVALAALNRAVERCVRELPEQYQWAYRRFAVQPEGVLSPYKQARRNKKRV